MKPNVVVMISHDCGKFFSNYNIDSLNMTNHLNFAKEGITLNSCFCATPLCAPARSAVLTGRYPHQNGMNGLPGDMLGNWDIVEKDKHLANVLKSNGYKTVLCGFEHETTDFKSVGLDEGIHGIGCSNNAGWPILGVGKDIDNWFESNKDELENKPFYMQIGCQEAHREWTGEPYNENGVWKAPYMVDLPEIDQEMELLQRSMQDLDNGFGEILASFEKHGMIENTIFVITTDHGIDFPRAKGTLFDPGIEVACFMRFDNGNWKKNCENNMLISHIDLFPTILEACEIEIPSCTVGKSFLKSLVTDDQSEINEMIFSEKTYHDNYDPIRSIRTKKYKYILNFDAQTLYDVRVATAPRYNWFKEPFNKPQREELYDLEKDPNETVNLATNSDYFEICKKFKKALALRMKETQDALLDGPIPSPYHLRISKEMKDLAQENLD